MSEKGEKARSVSYAGLPDWPRLMSGDIAAQYLSIGKTMLRNCGPDPKRLGSRVLYDRRDLDIWADGLGRRTVEEVECRAQADDILRRVKERLDSAATKGNL